MSRCKRTYGLEVHHIRPNKGSHLSNAVVLCHACYERTPLHDVPGIEPEPFSAATKELALRLAGHRCQCKSSRGCHTRARAHRRTEELEPTQV